MTADFRRRLLLAEGFYLALCEAALQERPDIGVTLWHVVRQAGMFRVVGRSGVPELIHMPFRVRSSPQSEQLLAECSMSAKTDKDLLDLAIAATVNGRRQWLDDVTDQGCLGAGD